MQQVTSGCQISKWLHQVNTLIEQPSLILFNRTVLLLYSHYKQNKKVPMQLKLVSYANGIYLLTAMQLQKNTTIGHTPACM